MYTKMILSFSRATALFAVQQLAKVDYNVANRVSDDVARVVQYSYAHDIPWLAKSSITLLQTFDDFGSVLIALVVWLVNHTP